jgi:hypothetical protein
MKNVKRACLVGALSAVFLGAGCIGPMNASSRLKTWNREIENRWAAEGVFLVLRYVPVYAACFLGDVLIFNSIEFWGGENPIDPVDPERVSAIADLPGYR